MNNLQNIMEFDTEVTNILIMVDSLKNMMNDMDICSTHMQNLTDQLQERNIPFHILDDGKLIDIRTGTEHKCSDFFSTFYLKFNLNKAALSAAFADIDSENLSVWSDNLRYKAAVTRFSELKNSHEIFKEAFRKAA